MKTPPVLPTQVMFACDCSAETHRVMSTGIYLRVCIYACVVRARVRVCVCSGSSVEAALPADIAVKDHAQTPSPSLNQAPTPKPDPDSNSNPDQAPEATTNDQAPVASLGAEGSVLGLPLGFTRSPRTDQALARRHGAPEAAAAAMGVARPEDRGGTARGHRGHQGEQKPATV